MYTATIETKATANTVFEALQATLLPHGFEMSGKTELEVSFRRGFSGIGKRSSPLTYFSTITVSACNSQICISASYGNLIVLSIIAAACFFIGIVLFVVLLSDIAFSLRLLFCLLGAIFYFPFLLFPYERARSELDTTVRSLSAL